MIFENTGSLDMLAGFLSAGIVNNQVDNLPEFEVYSAIGFGLGKFERGLGVPSRFNQKTGQVGAVGSLQDM